MTSNEKKSQEKKRGRTSRSDYTFLLRSSPRPRLPAPRTEEDREAAGEGPVDPAIPLGLRDCPNIAAKGDPGPNMADASMSSMPMPPIPAKGSPPPPIPPIAAKGFPAAPPGPPAPAPPGPAAPAAAPARLAMLAKAAKGLDDSADCSGFNALIAGMNSAKFDANSVINLRQK